MLEDLWLLCCREEMPPPSTSSSSESGAAGEQQRGSWCWVRPQVIGGPSSSSGSSSPSARAFHTATLVPGVGVLVFGECFVRSRAPPSAVVS
eukprot:COSAG01_NODE_2482_length_7600_cov_16.178110_9_plen_92_part_00